MTAHLEATQVALFDIDGTLTTGGGVWDILLKHPDVNRWNKMWVYASGLPHHIVTQATGAGQASFRDRWVCLMAGLLTGWTERQVDDLCALIVDQRIMSCLRADVIDVLNEHKHRNHAVVLVSTMFDRIVAQTAELLGADAGIGSKLLLRNGICTGKIAGETCSGARKIDFAANYIRAHWPDVTLSNCAAYADSQSDIPFIAAVGYPVAVYPDDAMRATAVRQQWNIIG